ncbi:MAG TPA: glycosyltransferase [Gaiellaceae bacterium]
MQHRITLVVGPVTLAVDAIRDYTAKLADALPGASIRVAGSPGWLRNLSQIDTVVLEYNPFSFGRWGFAPSLPFALARMRMARHRPAILLMLHETYASPATTWQWRLMATWQRAQLAVLVRLSDGVLISTERWRAALHRTAAASATLLPVGSNVPDRRSARAQMRAHLGADAETIVVGSLMTSHPSRDISSITAALNRLVRDGRRTIYVHLGADAPPLAGVAEGIAIHAPGPLSAEELAEHLAALDIYLAPFIEGVSTRRGSLVAALQHGIAVVGTEPGEPLLDGLLLVPAGRPDLFAEATAALAASGERRDELGRSARQIYEQGFDWQVIASQLVVTVSRSARVRRSASS